MAEPDNLVLVLLREMGAEMNARFDQADVRAERMEKKLEAVRQAAFGESLMARYTVAEVEDRLQAIEKRLERIETAR
jgi:hypothetical protein